jgi:hypothetical protein
MHMTRIRALAVVGVLALAAVILVVVTMTRDTQTTGAVSDNCKPGQVPVSLTMPDEPGVFINVFNGTHTQGLAGNVSSEFRSRKFNVEKSESATGPDGALVYYPDNVAILRFGPKAVASAHLVQAYFLNEAKEEFDLKREDNFVDVVLGNNFKQLATPTEMRQAVAILGRPKAPNGTCEQRIAQ